MRDLYHINDTLTALAHELGADASDETLDDLTHYVADTLLGRREEI